MNDRKSATVVSYHAALKYGVKIVEKKMKLLLQGLGSKGDLLFSGFSSAMKYGVKVWKLPKIRGIISRILEVTCTFLGSPYCGKLPFRELPGIYQDSGKENETTNSRLRVFSVACNAGSALHWIFFMQFDRRPCKLYYKKSDFKSTFLAKLLCCKNAAFYSTFCFAAMRDDVKNACIEKRTRSTKHCVGQ